MPDRTIKTVLEISGEGSYRNKLKEIGLALRGVASEQKVLDAQFGKSDVSMGKLVQQQALLESKLNIQKQKLEAVRQEYERVVQAEGKNSESARKLEIDYNYASAQFATTERSIKELNEQIEAGTRETQEAEQALESANAQMQTLAATTDQSGTAWERFAAKIEGAKGKLQKIGDSVSKVAGRINKALTAATTALVTYAGKAFMDFEDQMAVVSTIADTTAVSLEELSDQALAASNATGQAATEIAAATYSAISAGADTEHAVGLVEKAAKGAKAGLSDTETVIDGLTTSLNAWKISYDDAETVLDKMITTQNYGKTTLGELSQNMGKVTAFAPQVGVSLEEILAATAALTKNGYSTESAMTALKNVMSAAIKPTSQAKEAAKEMGLEFDAAALRSKGLVGFLQDIMDKTHGDEAALASLFGSVEGLGGVMLLAGGAAGDFAEAMDEISHSAGALDKAFQARTASRAEQMSMALNRLKNAAITFGQTLAPFIDMATGAIEKLTDKLGSMSEAEQKGLLQTAAWAIGLTGFVSVAGKVISHLGSIAKVIGVIGKAGSVLGGLMGGGGVTLGAVAGLAAITAAVVAVKKGLDSMGSSFNGAEKTVKAFSGLDIDTSKIDAVKEAAAAVREALEDMYSQEAEFSTDSNTLFADYIAWLTDGLPETEEQVASYKEQFKDLVQVPLQAIEDGYKEKKAQLDTLLAQGVITPEAYDREVGRLEKEAEDAQSKVQALADEFDIFTDGAVAQNAALNEEQIEYLGGLRDQIVGVTNDILEANNAVLEAAKLSEKRVMQGDGTAEDYAIAVEAARVKHQVQSEQTQAATEALEFDYRVRIDEASTAEEKAQLEGELKEITDGAKAAAEQSAAELSQTINDYTEAMFAQFPELADQMKEVTERTHIAEDVFQALQGELSPERFQELMASMGETDFDMSGLFSQIFNGTEMEQVFNEDAAKDILESWANGFMTDTSEIIKSFDPTQFGDFMSGIMAEIENGALADVDFSNLGDALDAALTVIDLSDDGKTIGMNLTAGEAEGLKNGEPEVTSAARENAEAATQALRDTLGVKSPSTVWAEVGQHLMEGLRNGIANNRRLISAALTQLSTLLRNYGRQSVQGWINGVEAMRPALVSAYTRMAEAAVRAAKARLQIASPSKVFAQIGIYSAEGMIAGLNSRVSAVQAAMERTVDPPRARRRGGSGDDGGGGGGNVTNNYYTTTYNVPYSGTYGSRDARKLSQQLDRVENSRKRGRGQ